MKAVVAAFNQEKALVGAFSVITNLRMEIFEALLKDKQVKRKEIRAEQDKKLAAEKKAEEDKLKKEAADKKAQEEEKKKQEMLAAEIKRQEMMAAQKEKGGSKTSAPAMDARKEMSKSKDQVEEEMKISLSIRIKPIQIDSLDSDELKVKSKQIWDTIVNLETDKYDFEQRHAEQDYEFKELNERQKIQLRNKAIKKGLDPESYTGARPPKIRMFSKYERRTDTRTYGDRKKLYEGGVEIMRAEMLEAMWKEKFNEWSKRTKAKLPKWFGERPGKKAGDAETPEGAEDEAEVAAEEDNFEEEEDEEEYDDE